MNVKDYLTGRIPELAALFLTSVLYLYLLPLPLAFLPSLASLLLSLLFLGLDFPYWKKQEEEKARRAFLLLFIAKLEDGLSAKESYDLAAKHLTGITAVPPFEDVLAQEGRNLALGSCSEMFSYVLGKEKQNEAHLVNYSALREKLDLESEKEEEKERKEQSARTGPLFFLLFAFLFLALVFLLFPALAEGLSGRTYLFLAPFLLALLDPLLYLFPWMKKKEEQKHA